MGTTTEAAEHRRASEPTRAGVLERPVGRNLRWGLVGVAAILGIALRIYIANQPYAALESDEAITGLMARHILHGEFPPFYWGQSYGGTIESFLTAGVFAALGPSPFTLRIVPTLLFAVAGVVLWFIGRRTVGAPAATIAVVLLMFWPMWIVWKSTRAHGFYGALVLLGLLVVLLTLKLDKRPTQWTAVGLGLAIGLGWWTNAQIALVAVPCLAWLVARRSLRHPILLGVSTAVGAEPWLMWNIQNNWDSLKIGRDLPDSTYFEHLRTFFTDVFPIALALRAPETPGWLFTTTTFAWTLHLIALGILVWALTKAWRSGGPMFLIAIIVVAYPFLYSLSPFTWYLSEPRYLILLIPFVALLFAWLLRRSAIATVLVASFMASLSVVGTWAATENDALTPDIVGTVVPTDMDPLVARLDRLDVRYVYAHYWIAYRLAFESDERIIATAPEFPRYPPFNDAVNAAEADAAHVFVEGTPDDPAFAEEHGSGYRRTTAGGFVIYVPKDSR